MTNTMVNNDFQAVATAVMNDVRASGVKIDTMDEMYEAVCKYVEVSREKFDELCTRLQNNDFITAENAELSEDELDGVVGGGICDWFSDHAAAIGFIAAAVGVGLAVGLGIGVVAGAVYAVATGCVSVLSGIGVGAAMCAGMCGGAGLISGIAFAKYMEEE